MSARKKAKPVALSVGDFVLLGGTRASYPGEWYLGEVLWVGRDDILVNRSTMNGDSYRQTCLASEVRAKGTIGQLVAVQDEARKAVQAYTDEIREWEQGLGLARAALFAKLDELAADGMKIIPPDFEKIEADGTAMRNVVEAVDRELAEA